MNADFVYKSDTDAYLLTIPLREIRALSLEHSAFLHHLYLFGSGPHMLDCLEAALEGANPSAFWMFCLMLIVQRM